MRRGRRGRVLVSLAALGAALDGLRRWRGQRVAASERREQSMEDNKRISRRVIEELFAQGRLELADELIAPNAISHDPALPEPLRGPEGVKQSAAGYRAAFPDIQMTIEQQIAEGESVATRWRARGTQDGELFGMAPTGKQATVTGITIDRIVDGKIVESWTNWDTFGLMQQLGAIPAEARA